MCGRMSPQYAAIVDATMLRRICGLDFKIPNHSLSADDFFSNSIFGLLMGQIRMPDYLIGVKNRQIEEKNLITLSGLMNPCRIDTITNTKIHPRIIEDDSADS